jgi:hypothetical protein
MRRILNEPLLHFLVLGALLFALYGWINRGTPKTASEIVVSQGQLANLTAQFARSWRRPPTAEERDRLIEQWVREEIFYREGLALGLDRNDPVVRRRIAQKVEFVAEGMAPSAPTDAELQAWLDAHRDSYAIETIYTIRQVFFDPARRGNRLDADLVAAREALQRGAKVSGDSTLLPGELDAAPGFEVARVFGSEFAESLKGLPVGGWSAPLRSGFGWHLVEIKARDSGRPATLAEARAAVERDWLRARTEEVNAEFYRKLRANYNVRIEGEAAAAVSTPKPAS